jgi:hypothetical protein
MFHVVRLTGHLTEDERENVWKPACTAVESDRHSNWFGAKDARTAVRGYFVLEAAVQAVRAGTLKSAPCPGIFEASKHTCEAAILENGDPSQIGGVQDCPAEPGYACYDISVGSDTSLKITARMSDGVLAPESVTAIAIEQYVIVT